MDQSGVNQLGYPMGPPQMSAMPSSSTTPAPSLHSISLGADGNPMDEVSQKSSVSNEYRVPVDDDGPTSSNNKSNEDNKSTARMMTEEKGKSFTNEALGNHLILRNVFQNLENNDVGPCCQVNEFWRSIAHPLYVRHYQVKLEAIEDDDSEPEEEYDSPICCFKITAHAMYERKKVIHSEETLEGACEFLLEAAKASRIAITFRSIWVWKEKTKKRISSFLSKTGEYVTRFVRGGGMMSLSVCCKWLRLMPNLIQLQWDGAHFIDDYFDPKDESIRMRSLRIIQVRNFSTRHHASVVRILKMAPNLEVIWSFPVDLVEALVETGKAFSVKSLLLQNPGDEDVKTGFRTLSHLGLKLKKFEFDAYPQSSPLCDAEYQPSVRRILESSRDSLECISLCETESFDFQALPPMTALKEIEFHPWLDSEGEKFFAPNTELHRIFPNVSVVKFHNNCNYYTSYRSPSLNAYVYEEQFASWGPQIQHLKLVDLSGDILRPMSLLFPSVQHLEFKVRDYSELKVMLREFGEYWPDMESLGVKVGLYDSECSLDVAFTGIPDVAVAHLGDPGLRNDHFSSKEIQNFKEGSVLRKLSKLKILKFPLEEYHTTPWDTVKRSRKLLGKLCDITAVCKEFGFQFLPDLKIVLQTSDKEFQEVSVALEASRLGTLVSCEVEYMECPY